jgi:hypothetical protein
MNTMPDPASGNRTILVTANDGTGNSQLATTTIGVNLPNTAPALNAAGPYELPGVTEDTLQLPGETVQAIIAGAGGDAITDPDPGAQEGIAVTSVDDSNGRWQYKTGTIWLDFGFTSNTAAVLLNGAARIRFVPDANYYGPAGPLTFRAWDLTTGANGQREVDVSVNGGSTAFSSASATATLTVTPVNDPPLIDLNGAAPGTGYAANFTANWGPAQIVSHDLGVVDVDHTTLAGAVVKIVNPVNGNAEQLTADTSAVPNISKHFDPDTHELRLEGTASVASYQQVLRSIAYNNTLSTPTLSDRQITFVLNDGATDGNIATSTVHLRETPVSHLYLPVIVPPRSDEPNDICAQAYGIDIDSSYSFLPDDRDDWYYFDLPAEQEVTVELTNFVPVNGQIIVARGTAICQGLQLVGSNGNHDTEKIVVLGTLPPGHYFIWIITDGVFNTDTHYDLLVRTES